MRDHGEAAQLGRVEFLKHHPVTDDVFAVVGQHRGRVADEEQAKVAVLERRERHLLWQRGGGGRQTCSRSRMKSAISSIVPGSRSGALWLRPSMTCIWPSRSCSATSSACAAGTYSSAPPCTSSTGMWMRCASAAAE